MKLRNPLCPIDIPNIPNTPPKPKQSEYLVTGVKAGPPFCECEPVNALYAQSDQSLVMISLVARINHGFLHEGGDQWIGYRRNYFCTSAAFSFQSRPKDFISREKFHIIDESSNRVEVTSFFMKVLSVSFPDGDHLELVQSNVTRLGPKNSPSLFRVVPGELPSQTTIKEVTNSKKRADGNKRFLQKVSSLKTVKQASILDTYPEVYAFTLAIYDRLLFPSTTKWRKSKYAARSYRVMIELCGATKSGDLVTLARIVTSPIQVRLRSPSQYSSPCREAITDYPFLSLRPFHTSHYQDSMFSPESPLANVRNDVASQINTALESLLAKTQTKAKTNSKVAAKSNANVRSQNIYAPPDEASHYFGAIPEAPPWTEFADYSAPDPLDDFGFGLHLIEADESIPRNFQQSYLPQPEMDVTMSLPSFLDSFYVDYYQE